MNSRLFGIYRGLVTDVRGPSYRLRIRLRVPAVLGEEESWAAACVQSDASTLPEVGAEVWVEFEGGDPSFPVCMGRVLMPGEGHIADRDFDD